MKKIWTILLLVAIIATPVFAQITASAFSDLGESVTKPISAVISIIKAVAVIAMVVSIIVTGIKFLTADGSRKPDILKNGIVSVVVCAVLLLAAFSLPKLFGLDGTATVGAESAVVAIVENYL